MTVDQAIRVEHLRKSFGALDAVQDVTFDVRKGEVLSLLGPNGAGKSTTISMLACLLRPTRGDALVLGHSIVRDPMAVKSVIGVVPQDIALYQDLSARENLEFWGRMYGLRGDLLRQRVDAVLATIGLADRQKGAVEKFSGGMKRRLNIGVALLHQPQIVIMDEPTVGIDPQSRRNILDSIKELKSQGMTVLYTTHYMEEAQELSDHVAIMDHGKVIAFGSHDELVKIVGGMDRIDLSLATRLNGLADQWRALPGVRGLAAQDDHVTLVVEDSYSLLARLFDTATRCGTHIVGVQIKEPNLEAVFLQLTGRALRD